MSQPKRTPKRKKPAPRPSSGAGKSTGKSAASARSGEPPKSKRNIPVLGIVFTAIAALLVAAILLGGNLGPGGEAGEPTVEGDSLPFFQSGAPDEAIGQVAPTVTGDDWEGNAVEIDHGDGTPTAVVFLAHWCQFCQAEVPKVQSWLDAGGGVPGVEFVSVATSINSARSNYPPSEWLEREGWTAPVIRDDAGGAIHSAYGAGGFPYWVFLNSDGTVAARVSGQLGIADLEGILLTLE